MKLSELECLLAVKRRLYGDVEVVVDHYEQLAECVPTVEVTKEGEDCLDARVKAPHTYVSIGCGEVLR